VTLRFQAFIKQLSSSSYVIHAWISWFSFLILCAWSCSDLIVDALIVTRFLVSTYLCSTSESAHSLQHYEYPFGSKSHWEFPASECRFGNIIFVVIIIVFIITIFLKQFICPSWYQCGLQVNERRELDNRSYELFPWSRNAKEFLFSVKNYTDVLESNLMQRNFVSFSCMEMSGKQNFDLASVLSQLLLTSLNNNPQSIRCILTFQHFGYVSKFLNTYSVLSLEQLLQHCGNVGSMERSQQ